MKVSVRIGSVLVASVLTLAAFAAPAGARTRADGPTTGDTRKVEAAPTTDVPKEEVKVSPVLECSFKDEKSGEYHSLFGYKNPTTLPVDVPIGPSNKFTGTPSVGAGQPKTFAPGRHVGVFVVNHKGTIVWTLTGRTSTAPGKACGHDPVPFGITGVGGIVILAGIGAVIVAVSVWFGGRRRRRNGLATS